MVFVMYKLGGSSLNHFNSINILGGMRCPYRTGIPKNRSNNSKITLILALMHGEQGFGFGRKNANTVFFMCG